MTQPCYRDGGTGIPLSLGQDTLTIPALTELRFPTVAGRIRVVNPAPAPVIVDNLIDVTPAIQHVATPPDPVAAPAERVYAIQQLTDAIQVALTESGSLQQTIDRTDTALQQYALQEHADAMAATQAQALPRTSAAGSDGPSFGQLQAEAVEERLEQRRSAMQTNSNILEAANIETNTAAAEEQKHVHL